MKAWLATAVALLLAGTASGTTVQDHRCLSGGRNDSIHLEWRWLKDGRADVRYAGQRERLPLLSHPDGTLLAAGDLMLAGGFQDWLATHETRLRWQAGVG